MGFLRSASPDLLLLIACGCFLIAVPWLLRSLFDRARGRKRCPRCRYDLHASPTRTCSECGHTAKDAADLLRTRRHWFSAAPALVLMLMSFAVGLTPLTRGDHWCVYLPDFILARRAPRDGSSAALWTSGWTPSPFAVELTRRIQAGSISPSNLLTALQNARTLQHRVKWPRSVPFVVEGHVPDWLPGCSMILRPRDKALATVVLPEAGPASLLRRTSRLSHLGLLPAGTTTLTFDVELHPSPVFSPSLPPRLTKLGAWTIDVELVASPADAVPLVHSDQPPLAIAKLPLQSWHPPRSALFLATQQASTTPDLHLHDFSHRALLLDNIEARSASSVLTLPVHGTTPGSKNADRRASLEFSLLGIDLEIATRRRYWTIKLVPDPELALTQWEITEIDGRTFEYRIGDHHAHADDAPALPYAISSGP